MNEKFKTLFENLGKPTLRGVRKCPKCGTYNGTRGMICKNKTCDVVFKEKKKPSGVDAVKINTGNDSHVFSARIHDRGPDYRGFVQLPDTEGLDTLQSSPELELIIQSAAQCFIDSCQQSRVDYMDITLCVNPCRHIRSSIKSSNEAVPMSLKDSALNALSISNEMKETIWTLATDSSGPLVQRISKYAFVVKCKNDGRHPLGFLHFYFFDRNKRQPAAGWRTVCECSLTESKQNHSKGNKKCLHYYACICALASDETLREQFGNFFEAEFKKLSENSLHNANNNEQQQLNIPVLHIELPNTAQKPTKSAENHTDKEHSPPKRKKKDISLETLVQDKAASSKAARSIPKKGVSNSSLKPSTVPIDESSTMLTFQSWLASVTERINQTMHFQFPGRPEPLVFHAPQMFFDCLQQRISSGSRKKRLPNNSTIFVRKDALPLGEFLKYSWHITNVLHVKQIFDTPEMPLLVTRSFVENRDGTYDAYEPLKNGGEELAERFKKTENQPLIKPLELKTFLKVGNMSTDSKDPIPFTVEWIPNILPESSIGELRITFEYGHLRNGKVEIAPPPCIPQL